MKRKWISRKRRIEKWQYVHRTAKFLFLGLFLFVGLRTDTPLSIPANLFFRFDPLIASSSMIASKQFISDFLRAFIIVLITLALGKVWCGWVYLLGTLLDFYGCRGRRDIPLWIRQIRYFVLSFILIVAIFSILPLNFFDPLTIFLRGLSGYKQLIIDPSPGWFVLILSFIIILALDLYTRRAWCRYFCPLGALLGLISKVALFKRRVERMDYVAPCKLDCPAGTNVTGYAALVSQGKFREAAGLKKEVNPFPAVCGYICPHPCEENCNRGEFDQFDHSIAINAIERTAAEYVLRNGHVRCKTIKITRKEKIAIIGPGPASLTAVFHIKRKGFYVKVFEKLPCLEASKPSVFLDTGCNVMCY